MSGPEAGLALGDLKEGVTAHFRTTLELGSYELFVDVFDCENSIYLGEASFKFTIVEPPAPGSPNRSPNRSLNRDPYRNLNETRAGNTGG
jgi:hypothetical protein